MDDVNRPNARRGGGQNKLRTYTCFKSEFKPEHYVSKVWNKAHRSALAKFRSGTAPRRLETGRIEKLPLNERLCPFCEEQIVEDELHVVLKCHIYEDLRVPLIELAWEIEPDVENYSDENVLYFILSNEHMCNFTAKTLCNILERRKSNVYI